MAPLEAIASDTPVVAHRSGGPAEFVTEECGRLVDSREKAEWVREITIYLGILRADHDYPNRVRECSKRFDWRVTLRPAVEVIAGLCQEAGRTPIESNGDKIEINQASNVRTKSTNSTLTPTKPVNQRPFH
jgi:hypothetical protein